jgi:Na+-translocating ferredoxin:NAD+ oxidoreductase RnfG subunit
MREIVIVLLVIVVAGLTVSGSKLFMKQMVEAESAAKQKAEEELVRQAVKESREQSQKMREEQENGTDPKHKPIPEFNPCDTRAGAGKTSN